MVLVLAAIASVFLLDFFLVSLWALIDAVDEHRKTNK